MRRETRDRVAIWVAIAMIAALPVGLFVERVARGDRFSLSMG